MDHGHCSLLTGDYRLPWRNRLPASPPRHDTDPNARATTACAANGRTTEFGAKSTNAIAVSLLDTQARGHIGRRVLHKQPDGELAEDSVWRWSSAPDRYLDTALRLEIASNPDIRPVDVGRAPVLGARLLVWNLESAGGTRLVGAVEFQITGIDQVVHTEVVRASEPVSAELPGDLAAVAGRLLRRLASEGLTCVSKSTMRHDVG